MELLIVQALLLQSEHVLVLFRTLSDDVTPQGILGDEQSGCCQALLNVLLVFDETEG